MATESPPPKGRDSALSTLNGLIQVLGLAKDTCGIPPAQVALGTVVVLLTMIRASSPPFPAAASFHFTLIQDSMVNKQDFFDLGLSCGDICQTLDRGLKGRRLDELSQSVLGAIEKLTR